MLESYKEYYETCDLHTQIAFSQGLLLGLQLAENYAKQFKDNEEKRVQYQTAIDMLEYLLKESDKIVHEREE